MRISGGKYVNKKIITHSKNVNTDVEFKATMEKTRQAIFNIINHAEFIPENFLRDAVVADIFCGSGSFGLEALSRGAKKAVFIDESPKQLEVARLNVESINETQNAQFIRADATNLPPMNTKCRIVYLDPPYNKNMAIKTLKSIVKSGILADEHLIVAETSKLEDIEDFDNIKVLDVRLYGKTKLTFCYNAL
jgi:16S rRNA (guanine966-N2)-methyltransferase